MEAAGSHDKNIHTEKERVKWIDCEWKNLVAVRTRLELATSCVTGRHSNQLNYRTIVVVYICFGGIYGGLY